MIKHGILLPWSCCRRARFSRNVKNDLAKVQRLIGRRIADLRNASGITQEQLAEQSEVDARYVQRIEAGEINVTIDTLVRIANVLRVGVGALFEAGATSSTRGRAKAPPEMRNAKPRRSTKPN